MIDLSVFKHFKTEVSFLTLGGHIDEPLLGGGHIDEPLLGGVYAPCSFHNFPPCSLFLSISCHLLLFRLFSCYFFNFLCSLLLFYFFLLLWDFLLAPCSFLEFSSAPYSFLSLLVLLAPRLSFVCSLLLFYFMACSLLLCVK